ncbi:MAG TPA: molybdate ABC transporter permease subunit, partial [Actinomycetota bacterium]
MAVTARRQRTARKTTGGAAAGAGRAPRAFVALVGLAVAFLAIPLAGLLVRTPWGSLATDLRDPAVLTALRLSLVCSVGAVAASTLVGVPLAWLLARVP